MSVGLSLGFELGLEQRLTPQQVQYLKLLQLTGLQLEQHISQELELNPMIEEGLTEEQEIAQETDLPNESDALDDDDSRSDERSELTAVDDYSPENSDNPDENNWQDYIEDEGNPGKYANDDDHNGEPIPIRSESTFVEDLLEQIALLNMSEEEEIIAEEILWSVESTGYLTRDLDEICEAVNEKIDALNRQRAGEPALILPPPQVGMPNATANTATTNAGYSLAQKQSFQPPPLPKPLYDSRWLVYDADDDTPDAAYEDTDSFTDNIEVSFIPKKPAVSSSANGSVNGSTNGSHAHYALQRVSVELVEDILLEVQTLEPPGIAARNLRECLLAQLRYLPKLNAAQQLAQLVLLKTYEAFTMRHYEVIMKELKVTDDYLREAIRAIRALNPKPGGGDSGAATSSIIPDFFIHYHDEKDDFIIQLNDSRVPNIHVNKLYEQMKIQVRETAKKGMKSQRMNKDSKQFFKQKYDDAKFLIQALKQRRQTMIRVMTAIVHRQREFFLRGKDFIRPLIYKNIAEDTGVDISTVCRVVNNKYTQTDYGIFELRYFFSEGIPKSLLKDIESGKAAVVLTAGEQSIGSGDNDDRITTNTTDGGGTSEGGGEDESDGMDEVSTRIVKDRLRDLIGSEPKNKPLSDEKLAQELKDIGYNIARRTVAKYRDQMGISPARLRREL